MTTTLRAGQTVAITGIFVLFAYLGTGVVLRAARLHLNTSDSVPLELYRETSDNSGPYAAFCLPVTVLKSATAAGLALDRGSCSGEVAPILKALFQASLRYPLTYSEKGFTIAGILLPNTAPKPLSRSRKSLFHYPFGTYTNGLWAISSYNPDSFDSRYFGPVEPTAIRFHATPLFTH